MTPAEEAKAKRLCEQLIKLIKRPDIVLVMLTDADAPLIGNTRILCNLGDKSDAITYLQGALQIAEEVMH